MEKDRKIAKLKEQIEQMEKNIDLTEKDLEAKRMDLDMVQKHLKRFRPPKVQPSQRGIRKEMGVSNTSVSREGFEFEDSNIRMSGQEKEEVQDSSMLNSHYAQNNAKLSFLTKT